ncbi:TetR/AcrR family transcriptional regulator [Flavonifractor hominis]|uniref:TetR/AcrR family transcriptional regulator n=1 Tax=Flavonifractor hominis TaxID=3133178 RepID=A0ABV1ERY7_9FIRM
MKQEERVRQMQQRILSAACQEFGKRGYLGAAVDSVCKAGGFSKGILYYYFKDKDSIYLACVQLCFNELLQYLNTHMSVYPEDGVAQNVNRYFQLRMDFFQDHPAFQQLFDQSFLSLPEHLTAAIEEIRAPLVHYNWELLGQILSGAQLRPGITLEEAMELLGCYQSFLNHSKRMKEALQNGSAAQEKLRRQWMNLLLYGIVESPA